jgi:hypothetical protein
MGEGALSRLTVAPSNSDDARTRPDPLVEPALLLVPRSRGNGFTTEDQCGHQENDDEGYDEKDEDQ